MSKSGNFFKGAIFGALAGVAAGVLFAPKSGKETREDIKNKAEELKSGAEKTYNNAKSSVEKKVAEFKKLGKDLSLDKYKEIVHEVVDGMSGDNSVTKEAGKKLKDQLSKDYNKVVSAAKA